MGIAQWPVWLQKTVTFAIALYLFFVSQILLSTAMKTMLYVLPQIGTFCSWSTSTTVAPNAAAAAGVGHNTGVDSIVVPNASNNQQLQLPAIGAMASTSPTVTSSSVCGNSVGDIDDAVVDEISTSAIGTLTTATTLLHTVTG